ncbi:hypothetical protein MMC10_003903 [Thelotrema lepadinum]|nr:hypothetical protein [Thelotrema lepadinum]
MATNVTNPAAFAKAYTRSGSNATEFPFSISDALRIDPDWASLLNIPNANGEVRNGSVVNPTAIHSMLDLYIDYDPTSGEYFFVPPSARAAQVSYDSMGASIAQDIATTLSVVLTDVLSRTAYNAALPFLVVNGSWPDSLLTLDLFADAGPEFFEYVNSTAFANMMPYNVTVMRYGYGYGLQQGATVKLSVAIVLVHAVLVIMYGIYRAIGLLSRRGVSSDAWEDMGEILALALLSDEAKARRAIGAGGAGVEKRKTLQKWVKIREGKECRVQMVVEYADDDEEGIEKDEYSRLVSLKKYA